MHVKCHRTHLATRGWPHGNVTVKPLSSQRWVTWSTCVQTVTKTLTQKEITWTRDQNHLGQQWKCHLCNRYFMCRLERSLHRAEVHPYKLSNIPDITDFVGGLRPPRKPNASTHSCAQESQVEVSYAIHNTKSSRSYRWKRQVSLCLRIYVLVIKFNDSVNGVQTETILMMSFQTDHTGWSRYSKHSIFTMRSMYHKLLSKKY